jgi:hypothetical protein
MLVTNGFGHAVKGALSKIPAGIEIENSFKDSPIQKQFRYFNVAPVDLIEYKNLDFSNGCSITSDCGIGLTKHGYYPCAIAGGIDRVFGFDIGKKRLPAKKDSMQEQLRTFCKYCGHFRRFNDASTGKEKMTPT